MAAAVLTKNGHLKDHQRRCAFHFFRQRTCTKHSIPDPPVVKPKAIIGNRVAYHFLQPKWCFSFPHSVLRKTKELRLYHPGVISSSSSKFGLVGWYLAMIKARPVSTKSIPSAFIYTAADFSSQSMLGETSEGYDLVRTLRMAGYGMLIIGPSLHYWFNFVSRVYPKRDLLSTFKKMALGQAVYGPIVTTILFSANAALQGESGSETIGRLKRDLIPTLASGIMYWPVCDFVTFKFIPVHLQPLVSNSFSYLWTVYLTYMASLAKVSTN
ncbi:pxmp2/4 family protein 4 [Phtheirospermum japonicum]|uniref:Pxmp2/4 family protein 4 n=1 Tax=Phtheirospermum japonicum TaxID=374723 RepID=A0A830CJV8_9LAMI|nr:pxmp2/4 family protein 4 [Phtheirospermum japonicum]